MDPSQNQLGENSIEERVKIIIAEDLNFPVDCVKNYMSLIGDLDADSLDVVEIGMVMESEFEIESSDEQVQRYFTTVQSIVDYIRYRLYNEGSASGNDASEAA